MITVLFNFGGTGAPRENHGKGQGGGESGDQVSPNTDMLQNIINFTRFKPLHL